MSHAIFGQKQEDIFSGVSAGLKGGIDKNTDCSIFHDPKRGLRLLMTIAATCIETSVAIMKIS